jgi:hypothetical protein
VNPGPIPLWLVLAVGALFTVGQVFPAWDLACAMVALGLTVWLFIARTVGRSQ